ncbi:MAG: EVE domain-containing protein [Planctomycetes bacterium]|nr:EVE domain-containing protein [Planctomycetota bacterium]
MATFLFKTEPSEYSFAHLVRDKRCTWTGVSNPAARIALRQVKRGDRILIYHTGDEKAIVAEAKALTNAYADPAQPGLNDRGEVNFPVVDLAPVKLWATPITLAAIKSDARLKDFGLVKQSRLSVMPVSPQQEVVLNALSTGTKHNRIHA